MNIEKEIELIKKRNKKVEIDKTWELSLTRKFIIFLFTYIIIVLFFYIAQLSKPFINALIPSLAFILSTLRMPFFKKLWLRNNYNK